MSEFGRSAPRAEDPRLVRGAGRFLEDIRVDGMLDLAFVRSVEANARLTSIVVEDTEPGELGELGLIDAAALGDGPLTVPVIWQAPGLRIPDYPALALDRVSYAGQPIAAVAARTRSLAEDAASRIIVEYEELPVVADVDDAASDRELVHPDLGTNVAIHTQVVTPNIERAFSVAHHVVSATLDTPRQTASPMERRGVLAIPQQDGGLTVYATVQHPHLLREHLAEILSIPIDDLRVIVADLGGAFGAYYEVYPEDLVVTATAWRVRRPIRWIEDRNESFLGTVHARQQRHRAELAVAADGRFLALRDRIFTDLGAFVDYSGAGPSMLTSQSLTGPYDIADVDIELTCAFTNKVRSGAYRGFGQPQAAFVMERLADLAARVTGLDPAEIRRRNFVSTGSFPYTAPTGATLDSGDYHALLDAVLDALDYDAARAEQAVGRASGRLVGVGIGCYSEMTGGSPGARLRKAGYRAAGWEASTVRVSLDGQISATSGASHMGQGIRTALAQLCADRLGLGADAVHVITGDTDKVPFGNRGSIGSRSAVVAGNAVDQAAGVLATRIRRYAGELLEASPEDIVLEDGHVFVAGSPATALSLAELAQQAHLRHSTALDGEPALVATEFWEPTGLASGSGVHACVVEVDPDTGTVEILRYVAGHDSGVLINPAIVEGQIVGGTVQGIGGALLEELVYDDIGQLRTGSLMDYLLPTAPLLPRIDLVHRETPAPGNSLGVKGCGEAGVIAPAAALANAVADAIGCEIVSLPMSPSQVWRLAKSGRSA